MGDGVVRGSVHVFSSVVNFFLFLLILYASGQPPKWKSFHSNELRLSGHFFCGTRLVNPLIPVVYNASEMPYFYRLKKFCYLQGGFYESNVIPPEGGRNRTGCINNKRPKI